MRICNVISKLSIIIVGILSFGVSDIHAHRKEEILVFDKIKLGVDAKRIISTANYRCMPGVQACAGSQFSADDLLNILNFIPVQRQNIWVIDLRQESHGFINGLPVSWTTDYNETNVGKTPGQIQWIEASLLKGIGAQKAIRVFNLKKIPNGKIDVESPVALLPVVVETEQQLVTSVGARYERIYVLDHHRPNDLAVDQFIYFVKNRITSKDWLHFHCRGGRGRASTFLAMYDIIRNAHKLSFDEIIQRQIQIGGKNLQPPCGKDKLWKMQLACERYEFLKKFYAYVLDPNGYQSTTWSAWKNQNK